MWQWPRIWWDEKECTPDKTNNHLQVAGKLWKKLQLASEFGIKQLTAKHFWAT